MRQVPAFVSASSFPQGSAPPAISIAPSSLPAPQSSSRATRQTSSLPGHAFIPRVLEPPTGDTGRLHRSTPLSERPADRRSDDAARESITRRPHRAGEVV
jgi:hypothetical protein